MRDVDRDLVESEAPQVLLGFLVVVHLAGEGKSLQRTQGSSHETGLVESSDLLPLELLLAWQLGSQELESYLHQLLVVVPEENLLSVGVDLQVDVDQIFPLTGW